MNPQVPTSLEYAQPPRGGIETRLVWKLLALFLFTAATFVTLLPTLHGDNGFWRIWLAIAPLASFEIIRRTSFNRAPVRAIFTGFFLVALWLIGISAMYHHYVDIDPHVLTRADNNCADNLRNIGFSLEYFAKVRHGGHYPDRLEELLDRDGMDVDPKVFVAPFSFDTPATGATTREVAANLSKPGHCSYIYLGKGLTTPCAPNTVILYEPLSNHASNIKGIHVLYDGQPEAFLPERDARKLIAELQSGHNPPRPEMLK
jgi:hypothetical protein